MMLTEVCIVVEGVCVCVCVKKEVHEDSSYIDLLGGATLGLMGIVQLLLQQLL